ncbi:unnamed protein product, partial [Rotaria sordida]
SPNSTITTTIITLITTTMTTTQSTTLTESTIRITPSNLLINPGAEYGSLLPWITGGTCIATIDNGSARSGCNPHSGTKQFFGGNCNDSNSTLTQSVLLLNDTQGYTVAQLDSGNLSTYISFYQQSWSGSLAMDKAQISLIFRTLNKTLI